MKILRAVTMGALMLTGTPGLVNGQRNGGTLPSPIQNPIPGPSNGNIGGLPPISGRNDPGDTIGPQMQEQQARSRNSERQKKLVEDTARLVALANDLKQQMDGSNTGAMTTDMVKKAEEIERLAKSVRERMRG